MEKGPKHYQDFLGSFDLSRPLSWLEALATCKSRAPGLWWQIALWGLDNQGAESTAPGLAEMRCALRTEAVPDTGLEFGGAVEVRMIPAGKAPCAEHGWSNRGRAMQGLACGPRGS